MIFSFELKRKIPSFLNFIYSVPYILIMKTHTLTYINMKQEHLNAFK